MKLDMGRAWNDATALISANTSVVTVVAGVFFFLPYFALSLLVPETSTPPDVDPEDIEAVTQAVLAVYQQYWWAFLLISILQITGMLALFALLTDRARPTVGDAITRGAKGLPSYFVTQILATIAVAAIVALPISFAAALGMPGIGLLVLLTGPIGIYLLVKFSLIGPVIGIEQALNPMKVLGRSWQLTKGNSLRLFGFFALLFVVYIVITLLVTSIAGVIFAAMGAQIALIGNAFVANVINAVVVTLYLAILVGVFRQLAGPGVEAISETFE